MFSSSVHLFANVGNLLLRWCEIESGTRLQKFCSLIIPPPPPLWKDSERPKLDVLHRKIGAYSGLFITKWVHFL